jgi:hypothetical protein
VPGITPVGPVGSLSGLVAIDDSPEASAQVVMGNPWPSPGSGYVARPLRYPGQLWSQGYGLDPTLPDPETDLIETPVPVTPASVPGAGTPYYDATPDTHAGPWVAPYDTWHPDGAAERQALSYAAHSDGLDNAKPGLIIAPLDSDWQEYWNSPADQPVLADGGMNKRVSGGWGSTDADQNPAGKNTTEDFSLHGHRRVNNGRNLPMNFLWMPGGQRPLVTSLHGLQALPVGAMSPYAGQDPSFGYGTAGAVLTMPAGDYEPPADPYQPGPLSTQNLIEGPMS